MIAQVYLEDPLKYTEILFLCHSKQYWKSGLINKQIIKCDLYFSTFVCGKSTLLLNSPLVLISKDMHWLRIMVNEKLTWDAGHSQWKMMSERIRYAVGLPRQTLVSHFSKRPLCAMMNHKNYEFEHDLM